MIKIGLLGVESKHAEYFASIFNIKRAFPEYRITSIWGGDAPSKIRSFSIEHGIDYLMDSPSELIDSVDVVIIILRNGNDHMHYAVEALRKGRPVFVDKPFTITTEDAQIIAKTADKTGTLLFGGSTLRHLPIISKIRELILTTNPSHISIHYSADPFSLYGGYYFYGSHLTELCTELCGINFTDVIVSRRDKDVSALVKYPDLTAMLTSPPYVKNLSISVFSSKTQHFIIDESECYYWGMKRFIEMLETKVAPIKYEEFVYSVEMLNKIMNCF